MAKKEPTEGEKRAAVKKFRDEAVRVLFEHRDWTRDCPAYTALMDQADAEAESGSPEAALGLVRDAVGAALDLLVREMHGADREVAVSAAETLLKLRRAILKGGGEK